MMKCKKVILSTALVLSFSLTALQAQQVIPASGGMATGSGGSASYTVGQVVYTIATGTSGSVEHGLQQPYTISTVTALEEAGGITLHFSAYPNPVTDYVTVSVEDFKTVNLTYQLYDLNGKLLENKKAEGTETSIDMDKLQAAIYFLKVIDNNKEVKTFKIIKSN